MNKEAQLTTKQLVGALIVIGVLIVIAIILVTFQEEVQEALEIGDKVLNQRENEQEESKQLAETAHASLLEDFENEEACNGDGCFCFASSLDTIPEGAGMIIQNSGTQSSIQVLLADGSITESSTQEYNIGLFVTKKTTTTVTVFEEEQAAPAWEFGCVFPSRFDIKGKFIEASAWKNLPVIASFTGGSSDRYVWEVVWTDDAGNTFHEEFYRDQLLSDTLFPELVEASYIYRLDDNRICLVSTLIEEQATVADTTSYEAFEDLTVIDDFGGTSRTLTSAIDFLARDARYCTQAEAILADAGS